MAPGETLMPHSSQCGVPANWKGKVAGPDADNVTNFHGGQISSLEN